MYLRNLILAFAMTLTFLTISAYGQNTHMGVPWQNQVTLEKTCNGVGLCGLGDFRRTLPDGTTEADPFKIPERHVLVVTDVDWAFEATVVPLLKVLFSDQQVTLVLNRQNDTIQASNVPFISTSPTRSTDFCPDISDCEEKLSAGANTQMTSGFIVTSGTKLNSIVSIDNFDLLKEWQHRIKVRGYLLPVERT